MTNLAKIISFILSPLFILLPVPYILVERVSKDQIYAVQWTIISYLFILAVAFFILIGVRFKIFTNFDVSKKEQRPILFLFTSFAIYIYVLFLYLFNGPKVLLIAVLGVVVGLIVVGIVNHFIKASIHLATMTTFLLFVSILYGGYYLLLLFLIPLLAWARIKSKEHTFSETVVGCLLGVFLAIIIYTISKYFLLGLIYN